MHDYLKTIKLGFGPGEPGIQGCWMTALSSHIGGEWTDRCECVDPTINQMCIMINDVYGGLDADALSCATPEQYAAVAAADEARTAAVMDFGLFAPLGTLGTLEDCRRRLELLNYKFLRLAVAHGLSPLARHAGDEPGTPVIFSQTERSALLDAREVIRRLPKSPEAMRESAELQRLLLRLHGYNDEDTNSVIMRTLLSSVSLILQPATVADYHLSQDLSKHADPEDLGPSTFSQFAWCLCDGIERVLLYNRYSPVGWADIAFIDKRVRRILFPLLRALIEAGPHAKEEPGLPACGVQAFQQDLGATLA